MRTVKSPSTSDTDPQATSLASKYDQYYTEGDITPVVPLSGWPRDRNQAIVSVPGHGRALLDIGCGNGEVLYEMRHRYKTLTGTELSSARLQKASQLLTKDDFRPVLATGDTFPEIASGSIDRAISSDVIEHTVDIYSHLADIFRVLRPGGDLVVNTPNIALVSRRLQLLIGEFPATSYGANIKGDTALFDGGHLHYFTFPLLSRLLRQTGFHVIGKMGFGRFGRLHNLWPEMLSSSVQIHARRPPGQQKH
ncbi:MAG: class I SAM-dependent methyltransferase [Verrucomicrobia bacterium]|nr:class I SAM-dependent methyltransferase [Verrucomicrobiota bacterium]MBT7065405.1 class I SAM-dependent methyltransferase [Verrucomicrobiota bacterium]MBT7700339.1 class I SAM-dependent methyltransferase [Verrucomicrobiota bacterium]